MDKSIWEMYMERQKKTGSIFTLVKFKCDNMTQQDCYWYKNERGDRNCKTSFIGKQPHSSLKPLVSKSKNRLIVEENRLTAHITIKKLKACSWGRALHFTHPRSQMWELEGCTATIYNTISNSFIYQIKHNILKLLLFLLVFIYS